MSAPESAIGLVIGIHYVKVVRLVRRLGRPYLAAAEMLRLPNERENVTEVIQRFLESKELLKYPCAICTPTYSSMLHTIDIAENDPRPAKDIVSIEIDRLNDISEEKMLHDFMKLSETSSRQTLLIAMGREAAIERMLRIPDAIGLEVVSVTPTPVAVFSGSFPRDTHPSDVAICAHISHAATHVAIGSRNRLLFSRHFDHGGDQFTDAIATCMGIGPREAEELKLRHGFSINAAAPGTDALDALKKAADAWLSELNSTLAFYRERFATAAEQPRLLVLSGGGAELTGFAGYMAEKIDIEVRPFEPPWSGRVPDNPGRYAVAGGLALAALRKSQLPLNLLPPARKDSLHLRAQIPYWKTIGAALCLLLFVWSAGRFVDYRRRLTYAESVAQRLQGFKAMESELEALKKENARLGDRLRFAHRGMQDGMILRAIMGAIANVMHPDDWLILVADSKSYFSRVASSRGRRQPPAADLHTVEKPESQFIDGIIIEGYTPREDFATVKGMIEKLRQLPYVDDVDLLTDDRVISNPERNAEWAAVPARLFAVEIKIRKP
jgi:Tfp pilus assembly PilM family ATPase